MEMRVGAVFDRAACLLYPVYVGEGVMRIEAAIQQRKIHRKQLALRTVYHIISVTLIVISLLFTVLRFQGVNTRMGQALNDLTSSLQFAFQKFQWSLGSLDEVTATATVSEIPDGMTALLPVTWEEFTAFCGRFFTLLFDKDNIFDYLDIVFNLMMWGSYFFSLFLVVLAGVGLVVWMIYSTPDTKHGQQTKAKKAWFQFEDKFISPPYAFVHGYLAFLNPKKGENGEYEDKVGRRYLTALKWIWLWNLNILTIAIETIAFIVYFFYSLDLLNILVQAAKFAIDITVALDFLPVPIVAIIAWKYFDKWRRKKGLEKLQDNEDENQEFLEEHPENIMATGEPRIGKTQAITDFTLSQNDIYKKKAKEKSRERKTQFPFFPWGILEQTIKNMRKRIPDFNLAFLRGFCDEMEYYHKNRDVIRPEAKAWMFCQWRKWGYIGKDLLCNYDYKRHGEIFHAGTGEFKRDIDLFESIRMYAEEFYIYSSETPLAASNYPIKFRMKWKDYGNYPLLDINFFERSEENAKKNEQFSHLLIYDMMRLGKKKNPTGAYNDNFELGSATIAEIGKERGNQKTNQGTDKNAEKCNTANDLFEMDAKMRSHGTTIDFYTYFRIFSDEQRAMELLAALREIGSECKISNKKKPKILMPGFAFEELAYEITTPIVNKIADFMDSRHGKDTLFMYLVMRVYYPIFCHYWRVYNQYSSYDVDLKIMNQAQGQTMGEADAWKYHISTAKVRSNVYDTGYFGVFYREKAKRSKTGGINQIPQWEGLQPPIKQLRELGSHHYDAIFKQMSIEEDAA